MENQNAGRKLEAIILAGKILIEAGAEIYRVEDTMAYMAESFGLKHFRSYVTNKGIIVSIINNGGVGETQTVSSKQMSFQLQKLEAVNQLSRELAAQKDKDIDVSEVIKKLNDINKIKGYRIRWQLISSFLGAGGFSLALGSDLIDSFIAAFAGLLLGLVMSLLKRYIKTSFLRTIISSCLATMFIDTIFAFGIGEYRSIIILGAMMVLIPGAVFVNSVREFCQNNFYTGISLLMIALLECISISVGVAMAGAVLPFSKNLSPNLLTINNLSLLRIIICSIGSGFGTIGFSILFNAPKKHIVDIGIMGTITWFIYLFVLKAFNLEPLAIFLPGLFVTLASRILSVKRKCPMTIFLYTSLFPLIPGLSFYRATYYFIVGESDLAMSFMRSCFVSAFVIAVAISMVQQLPRQIRIVAVKQ